MALYERYIIHTPKYGISRNTSDGPDMWYLRFRKDQMTADQAMAFGETLARFHSFSSCNSLTITPEEYRYPIKYIFENATKLQAMMIRIWKSWEKFMNNYSKNEL